MKHLSLFEQFLSEAVAKTPEKYAQAIFNDILRERMAGFAGMNREEKREMALGEISAMTKQEALETVQSFSDVPPALHSKVAEILLSLASE